MKPTRQFIPLLKLMLGFYRYGPLPLLIYVVITGAVLLASSVFVPTEWMAAHVRQSFWGGDLLSDCIGWWCLAVLVATPVAFQVLGGTMSLEFLFTRAVDRGVWLRTERVAVVLIALGPVILSLLFSPFGPKLTFEPAAAGSTAAAVQARYLQIFPGSQVSADTAGTEQLVIRHGAEIFAAWMLWFGLISIFLVAAYFSVVFTAWQRASWHHSKSKLRPWLGGFMVNAPAYVPVAFLLLCAALRFNPLEESFLLFAGHPVCMILVLIALALVVQRLSERNLRKLEFEFS